MKYVLYILFAVTLCNLSAALFERAEFVYRQPDGSQLSLFSSGDEFEHRIHDAQGFTILTDPVSGYAVYAVTGEKGIVPSLYRVGSVDPAALGISPNLLPDPEVRNNLLKARESLQENSSRANPIGTINNVFIFIRFLDQSEYTTPASTYEAMVNSTVSESMHGYFLQDSGNQLTVNGSFFPAPSGGLIRSFQDGHNRGYFSPYNAATNPEGYSDEDQGRSRMHVMFKAAVNAISASVPSGLNVDGDGDGFVDT